LALPLSQSPPENGKWGLTPLFPPGPRGRPRVPHEGRRLHERPHRDLDRLETREGTDGTRPPAAPVRILPVLRQLSRRCEERKPMRRDAPMKKERFVGDDRGRTP